MNIGPDLVVLRHPLAGAFVAVAALLAFATSPAAGSFANAKSQAIASAAVASVSRTTSARLVTLLNASGAAVAPGATADT